MEIRINDEDLRKAVIEEVKAACKNVGRGLIHAEVDAAVVKHAESVGRRLMESGWEGSSMQRSIVSQVRESVLVELRPRIEHIVREALPSEEALGKLLLDVVNLKLEKIGHQLAGSLAHAMLDKKGS
jgi:hypothetical protein